DLAKKLGDLLKHHGIGGGDCNGTPAPVGGGTGGVTSGGSIFDKLFDLLAKLQKKLEGALDDASKIDPKDQASLQKAMFTVQQIQNQMSEVVRMATQLQKTQHETDERIDGNL